MSMSLPIIDCSGCGQCCRNQPYPPFLWWNNEDVPPEPHYSQIKEMILAKARADTEPCLWLTPDGRCGHYEIRPEICREFELGCEECLEMRAEVGLSDTPRLKPGACRARPTGGEATYEDAEALYQRGDS